MDPKLKVESVPPALRPGVIEDSADCTWFVINPCFHRGLKEAVETFPAAEWFYTVSSDAIPVKTFAEMYTGLRDDPRSRIEFSKMIFDRNAPKASNWVLLSRPLASTLSEMKDLWINEKYHTTTDLHLRAGADEWAVYLPLLKRFGEDFFAGLHPGIISVAPEARPLNEILNTFACWGYCDVWGTFESHLPPVFTNLIPGAFDRIRSSATVTHARKFRLNTTVAGCPARRVYVTMREAELSLGHLESIKRESVRPERRKTAGRDRSGIVLEPVSWSAANFGPYHANATCTITDFVSWRLNLNSTIQTEEEKGPLILLPSNYQSFQSIEAQHRGLIRTQTYGVRQELIDRYNIELPEITTTTTTTTTTTETTTTSAVSPNT